MHSRPPGGASGLFLGLCSIPCAQLAVRQLRGRRDVIGSLMARGARDLELDAERRCCVMVRLASRERWGPLDALDRGEDLHERNSVSLGDWS